MHDSFVDEFGDIISQAILPENTIGATGWEDRIVISTIQWLGTPVGISWLEQNGFKRN